MKSAAFVVTLLVASIFAINSAQACGMMRRPVVQNAKFLVADAKKAAKRGDDFEAVRLYEFAMNHPNASETVRAGAAYEAGVLHEKLGNLDRATDRFRRAVGLSHKHSEAQLALGRHLRGDDDAAAVVALKAALKGKLNKKDKALAEALIAGSFARLGQLAEAETHLKNAKKLQADTRHLDEAAQALETAKGNEQPTGTSVALQAA